MEFEGKKEENYLTSDNYSKVPEIIALITGVLLLIGLSYLILPVLSPLLVTAAILFLFYPLRQNPYVRRLMWVTCLLFAAWLFNTLKGVLAPFIIAFLIAYLFSPLVGLLERRNIPRWVSTFLIMLLLLGGLLTFFVLFIPIIILQFQALIGSISNFANNFMVLKQEGKLAEFLARLGIPLDELRQMVARELPPRIEGVLKALVQGIFGFLSEVSTLIGHLVDAVIIPLAAFYLLLDFPKLTGRIASFIQSLEREWMKTYISAAGEIIDQYIRGTFLVAGIKGVLAGVGLFIIGVQDVLVLGIISGILNLIPFVGFFISLILAVIVALLGSEPVWAKVVSVIVLYVGLNVLDTVYLGPKIIGRKVGLHPVLLILSLAVFGYFLGFVGMLIAVPTTALILLFFKISSKNKDTSESSLSFPV